MPGDERDSSPGSLRCRYKRSKAKEGNGLELKTRATNGNSSTPFVARFARAKPVSGCWLFCCWLSAVGFLLLAFCCWLFCRWLSCRWLSAVCFSAVASAVASAVFSTRRVSSEFASRSDLHSAAPRRATRDGTALGCLRPPRDPPARRDTRTPLSRSSPRSRRQNPP